MGDQDDPSTVGDDLEESVDVNPVDFADIGVAKYNTGTPVPLANGNFEVNYLVAVENTGNLDLANLTLAEDLASQFGPAFIGVNGLSIVTPPADPSSTVTLNSGFNGASDTEIVDTSSPSFLAVGDSFIFEFIVEVDPDATGTSGPLNNQVTADGDGIDVNGNPAIDGAGNPITATDDSDSGTDPTGDNPNDQGDNGTSDDPTPLLIPDIGIAKTAGDATPNGENFDVTFTLVVENTGTVTLDNLAVFDDVAAQFGNAFVATGGATVQNFVGSGTAPTGNTAFSSNTSQSLTSGGILDVGDSFEITFLL